MKRRSLLLLVVIFVACLSAIGYVQARVQAAQYHISTANGIRSDHVYNYRVDRYGYLWIATARGVYKYNGYRLQHFGIHDGLPNDDVWDMYEDRKGRMWLLSIAPEPGYIYKDHYHTPAGPAREGDRLMLSPRCFVEKENGIAFLSSHREGGYLYEERQDTLRSTMLPFPWAHIFLSRDGKVLIHRNDTLTTLNEDLRPQRTCYVPGLGSCYLAGPYLIPSPYRSGSGRAVPVYDIRSCSYRYIDLEAGETILMIYNYGGCIYLTTNRHVYIFDDRLVLQQKYSFAGLLGDAAAENSVVTMIEDSLWGACIATRANGGYINFRTGGFTGNDRYHLDGYRHLGTSADSQLYWWQPAGGNLLTMYRDGHTRVRNYKKEWGELRRIVPYNKDKSLAITARGFAWLYADGHTVHMLDSLHRVAGLPPGAVSGKKQLEEILYSCTDAVFTSPQQLYLYSFNNALQHLYIAGDSVHLDKIDDERLPKLMLPSGREVIAHDDQQLLVYNTETGKKFFMRPRMLAQYGIKKIEQVSRDRYDNIYIKTYDRLVVYHARTNDYQRLLPHYQMEDAVVQLNGDELVVAARAGVLCCRINGPGDISAPRVYLNPKGIFYQRATDLVVHNDTLLLQTDKGLYSLPVPGRATATGGRQSYRMVVSLNDTTVVAAAGDTLRIDQHRPDLKFDIINPMGSGSLQYRVRLQGQAGGWTELNANEYHLQGLTPGQYYRLYVVAQDDAWTSRPVLLTVYLQPWWWQSAAGKRMLWALGIIACVLMAGGIAYITKRIVSRQHRKKNLELELKNLHLALELKSLYSQINPHFIFNTLATGLYYIKKQQSKEAYRHISSFSDLLRSYLKASRNKYTTIGEEIRNLENYMQLQLARFDDKFSYEIIVGDNIDRTKDKIPSLLLQPIVENAINHGLFHKETKGKITISFSKNEEEQAIICLIDDDGIGREQSRILKDQSHFKTPSYGTDLIKGLVDIFNKYEPTKISLHYTDKQAPLSGTTVQFTIKYTEL